MNKLKTNLAALTFFFVSFSCALNGAQAATITIDDDNEPSAPDFLTTNTAKYADATACIQAAFDKALSGDTVVLREGDYPVIRQIKEKFKNLTIKGEGTVNININTGNASPGLYFAGQQYGPVTITAAAAKGSSQVTLSSSASVIAGDLFRISNSTLWCPLDYDTHKTGEMYEVASVSGNTVTLTTPLIRDYAAADTTVYLYHPVSIQVQGIRVIGAGVSAVVQGLTLEFCKDSSITNNFFDDNGQAAMYLRTCSNVDVGYNEIRDSNLDGYGYGVAPVNASANIRIHNNLIRNCRHAITSGDSSDWGVNRDIYITDNELHRDTGISAVVDAHPTTLNYIVTGNTIYADGQSAFNDGTLDSVFSNNTVYNGIAVTHRGYITGGVKVISNNRIIGAGATIFVENRPGIKELTITGNTVEGTGAADGLRFESGFTIGKLTFTGNTLKNTRNGININLSGAANSEIDISDNIFDTVNRTGIYFKADGGSSANPIIFSDNTIKDPNRNNSTNHGIWLVGATNVRVSGNNITDSSGYTLYGVNEDTGSNYNTIRDNLITGMKTGAVKLIGANSVASNNGNIQPPSSTIIGYALAVSGGSGSGSFAAGTSVIIIANAPAAGKEFDRWSGCTDCVANLTSASTTVNMPARSVSVSATYKDIITTTTPTDTTTTSPSTGGSSGGSSSSTTPPASSGSSSSGSTSSSPTGAGSTPASTYPTGTLLKLADSFKVYVVIEGKKKWISTPEVFEQLGYKWTEIKILTTMELNAFADYEDNLIRQIGDYKVYLVVSGVRRHIPNPAIFLDYGFKWEEVKDVPAETIEKYKAAFLLKESGKEGIYYVSANEIRKFVPTTAISESYGNKAGDIQVISKTEMESYPVSQLINLTGSNDIYFIEGTAKRLVPSAAVFIRHGFDWGRVITVNRTEFDYYQDGGELS